MTFALISLIFLSLAFFEVLQFFFISKILFLFLLSSFVLIIANQYYFRFDHRFAGKKWFDFVLAFESIIMGLFAVIIFFAPLIEITNFINFFFLEKSFLSSANLHYFLLFGSLAVVILGFFTVKVGPLTKKVRVVDPVFPSALDGLKIVQISDLHIGPTIKVKYVNKIVSKVNHLKPDLIFVTGDLIDSPPAMIVKHLEPFKNLQAKFGIYFVTGNHEYYWGAQPLIELLESFAIKVLKNENEVLEIAGKKIMIAGINDKMASSYDFSVAKSAENSSKADYKILLSHRPEVFPQALEAGFNLQFSGHTHSGQFFPFNLIIGFFHKFYKGLNQHQGLQIYVNQGTGYWGPMNRFAVPCEITCCVLSDI